MVENASSDKNEDENKYLFRNCEKLDEDSFTSE